MGLWRALGGLYLSSLSAFIAAATLLEPAKSFLNLMDEAIRQHGAASEPIFWAGILWFIVLGAAGLTASVCALAFQKRLQEILLGRG